MYQGGLAFYTTCCRTLSCDTELGKYFLISMVLNSRKLFDGYVTLISSVRFSTASLRFYRVLTIQSLIDPRNTSNIALISSISFHRIVLCDFKN